jgi:hypothetical protein
MTYPLPPNAVDLTFDTPATAVPLNAVDLTFGATAGPPPGTVYAATMTVKFALRGSVTLNYNTAVWRGLSTSVIAPSAQAAPREAVVDGRWQPSEQAPHRVDLPVAQGAPLNASASAVWSPSVQAQRRLTAPWQKAEGAGQSAVGKWLHNTNTSRSVAQRWQRAEIIAAEALARFGLAKNTPKHADVVWQAGKTQERVINSPVNRAAKPMPRSVAAPWQRALLVGSEGGPRYLPPPPAVTPPPPEVVVGVQFCALYPETDRTTLVFGLNPCGSVTPDSQLYILPARFYMAVHSITATTFPGLVPIRITDVSLSADVDSTVWTFSARGPVELFDELAPTAGAPAQIKVSIDDIEWVFLVDRLQRDTAFGRRGAAISGRSATALVGQPYARETSRRNTTARNAQQIAADALALSGVGLDWGITDWLVSSGAWSHTGTPLAAVQAVAQAAGGYINSHRSEPTVLVRHPYPTLPGGIPGGPWNWGGAFAADVELAPDAIVTSSIERVDGPDIDGVYVSGETQGLTVHVLRQGTTGLKLAPMEVDNLITANAAAQQRGYSVLGKAGAKHLVQITLPVLTGGSNPGVLEVGQLVQINEAVPWRGRVRSVGVQASQPSVRQTVALERHLA